MPAQPIHSWNFGPPLGTLLLLLCLWCAGCGGPGASSSASQASRPTVQGPTVQGPTAKESPGTGPTTTQKPAPEEPLTSASTGRGSALPAEKAEPTPSAAEPAAPAPAPVAVRPTAGEKAQSITFDTIKFDIEKGGKFEPSMITPEIHALVGRKVRIRGYILPAPVNELSGFTLVRDNMECCFGPMAALYDSIQITLVPGMTTEYTTRPIAVEGVFAIKEMYIGKRLLGIFAMEVDLVK